MKTDFNGVFADPAAFAKKVHLLYLGVGTAETERFTTRIRGLHTALTEAGVRARVLGVTRHRPRMADVAPKPEGFRREDLPEEVKQGPPGYRGPPRASDMRWVASWSSRRVCSTVVGRESSSTCR